MPRPKNPQVRLETAKTKALEQERSLLNTLISGRDHLPHIYGWKHYTWSREFFETTNRYAFLVAANQIGKAIAVSQLIPTPAGFRRMGDLQVGDFVFSQDGSPAKVIAIPYEGRRETYRVWFNDGSFVECCGEHLWIAKGYKERFRKVYFSGSGAMWRNSDYGKWKVFSLDEIIRAAGLNPNPTKRFSIPICGSVEFARISSLLDPYFVGCFIGNGASGNNSITLNKKDIDAAKRLMAAGCVPRLSNRNIIILGVPSRLLSGIPQAVVLSYLKTIPSAYLRGDVAQRKSLLAGLMDTDGYCSPNGQHYSYSTTSKELAIQVRELVCSLGGIAQVKKKPSAYTVKGVRVRCRSHYVVTIWTLFNPFFSKRKSVRHKPNSRYKHERVLVRISRLGRKAVRCITVDNKDGSFLCTKDYVVTHNSTVQIRKVIHWATEPSLWPKLWTTTPRQFWYLYPSKDVATVEWRTKWVVDIMPSVELKDHSQYGWQEEIRNRNIFACHFKSGVSIYFKTYAQDIQYLQTGSCHYIACDEELVEDLFDELNMRIAGVNGYFSMVFTATLGQELWRQTLEGNKFPKAFKRQVSMHDCQFFEDGTPSHWTKDRIEEVKQSCKSDAEIQRRVYGKFVIDEGLMYPGFVSGTNVKEFHLLPKDWRFYAGVDPGGGGAGHPAAICFVATDPEFRRGRVIKTWRGDGITTTASDILTQFQMMKADLVMSGQYYDWACKDFGVIASRAGQAFQPADKNREIGLHMVNSLFKNEMLHIYDTSENAKLVRELCNIRISERKTRAHDNLCDALRYAISKIPWDWTAAIKENAVLPVHERQQTLEELRREFMDEEREEIEAREIEYEFEEWNSLYVV